MRVLLGACGRSISLTRPIQGLTSGQLKRDLMISGYLNQHELIFNNKSLRLAGQAARAFSSLLVICIYIES